MLAWTSSLVAKDSKKQGCYHGTVDRFQKWVILFHATKPTTLPIAEIYFREIVKLDGVPKSMV